MASLFFASSISAQQPEKRIALVIGNSAYQAEALPTAANDAGLIAQTLQAAGFDVFGARDFIRIPCAVRFAIFGRRRQRPDRSRRCWQICTCAGSYWDGRCSGWSEASALAS